MRLWDPGAGEQVRALEGHQGGVRAVCSVTVAGRVLLASGSDDQTVRLWDPVSGVSLITIPVHYPVLALSEVASLLAIGLDAGVLVIKLNAPEVLAAAPR